MRKSSSVPMLIFVLFVGVCLSITAHAQEAEIPEVEWSMYVGGSRPDFVTQLVTASEDSLYLVGHTYSNDLTGRINEMNVWFGDGYVSKLSLVQRQIIWAKYFGGDRITDDAFLGGTSIYSAFYCPEEGVIYIAGSTHAENLPAKLNERFGGRYDAFVSKINVDGEVLWTSYIGGQHGDSLRNLVRLTNGNIVVGGRTYSDNLTGKINDKRFDEESFFAELTSDGELLWSRYLGIDEYGGGKEVFSDGDIYKAWTIDNNDVLFDDSQDACVARISSQGEIRWNTNIGIRGNERAKGIALDSKNNIYVVGVTIGIWDIDDIYGQKDKHPLALNSRYSIKDAFVAKLNPDGEILWLRYIGGQAGVTEGTDIVIDSMDEPVAQIDMFQPMWDKLG